jgi:Flp pilus assembly protein TadD
LIKDKNFHPTGKNMHYLLVFILVLLAPLCWAETVIVDESCNDKYGAKLVSLQGKLLYDPNRKGHWQSARLQQMICEGSGIKVEANSRASIRLASGVVLRLHEGTYATLDTISPDNPTFLHLFKGFIHFISRTPRLLKISTPIANAGPEGTEFAMSVDDTKASLWVYEGGVKFFNDKGSIHLSPGQGAQASLGQAPQARIDIKPQDAVNWALYYPPVLPYPQATDAIEPDIRSAIQDYRQGRIDLALERLDGLSQTKQTPYFYKVRAALRLSAGQDQRALQDIQAILSQNPNDAEALALQSVRELTQNRKDQALTLANKAIAANPESASAYSALSYAEQGRFNLDQAQAAADQAAKLAPHDAMVWARKAELELSQGLTSQSNQAAKTALQLDPSLERTQTITGFAQLLHMDTGEALQSFTKATELDSTAPLPRLGLGLAKIRNGDLEEGREDLETAAILDPNNSIVRSYLGKAYYEERRSPLVEDQFNLAKDRDPKDPTPYFYDAINKQTTNRPVEALQDMQKAIELNDNRGVYRSRLMLDEDRAARGASLARIYSDLGFRYPALVEASNSLNMAPANSSAHRFLADTYAELPRHEIARVSELLQAQLLQPLNLNPIQPRVSDSRFNFTSMGGLSQTSFNEFNPLFERNRFRLITTGFGANNNTLGDEIILSGLRDNFSFSLSQLYTNTDGFRINNDIENQLYGAFGQWAVSPTLNIQAEYRRRETRHGDLALNFDPNNFDRGKRRNLEQDIGRLGIHKALSPSSDFIASLFYSKLSEDQVSFFNVPANFEDPNSSLVPAKLQILEPESGFQFEAQHLYTTPLLNLTTGLSTYDIDSRRLESFFQQDQLIQTMPSKLDRSQNTGYLYANINWPKGLTTTAGFSYDSYEERRTEIVDDFNPKFGLQWNITNAIRLRMAYMETVKQALIVDQTLQPTQVAGFNQFFDDINGTQATRYGVGLDTRLSDSLYWGAEVSHRNLKVPLYTTDDNGNPFQDEKWRENLYRVYAHWAPTANWSANLEFRLEEFDLSQRLRLSQDTRPGRVDTLSVPFILRYFDSSGLFAHLGTTFVHQEITQGPAVNSIKDRENFLLLDMSLGYRLPKRYGLIKIEVRNLLDENFFYQDDNFRNSEQRNPLFVPDRTVLGVITLNF